MYNTTPAFIEYQTNHDFRTVFRRQFGIDESSVRQKLISKFGEKYVHEIDEESLDELLLDEQHMSAVMDYLYKHTQKNREFIVLYTLGAAKWISEDMQIGQCILLSYDYYYLYHACLCVFFDSPDQWNDSCPYYIQLRDKLHAR
jgi:hypothetical protein